MRVSSSCTTDLLVEDPDGVDIPVAIMSDEELAAAAPWLDDVIAVAPQTRLEPGGLRDAMVLVEEMRGGAYIPVAEETDEGPIEPQLARCRARLRTEGWRLLARRVDRHEGNEVRRCLVLAAVRHRSRATVRVRLDAGASRRLRRRDRCHPVIRRCYGVLRPAS